jgi:hypothetical protein
MIIISFQCHTYTRCTSEAGWQAVVVLAVGFLLYADYLSDIADIASFLFRDHRDQHTFGLRNIRGKTSRSALSDTDNQPPKPDEKESDEEKKKEKEDNEIRITTAADLLTSDLLTSDLMTSDLLTPYECARYDVMCRERTVQMQGDHDYQFSFYEGDEPEIVITYEY